MKINIISGDKMHLLREAKKHSFKFRFVRLAAKIRHRHIMPILSSENRIECLFVDNKFSDQSGFNFYDSKNVFKDSFDMTGNKVKTEVIDMLMAMHSFLIDGRCKAVRSHAIHGLYFIRYSHD